MNQASLKGWPLTVSFEAIRLCSCGFHGPLRICIMLYSIILFQVYDIGMLIDGVVFMLTVCVMSCFVVLLIDAR